MDDDANDGFEITVIDLEAKAVLFRDGFSASITRMLDDENDDTFELDEVEFVCFTMPPDAGTYCIRLADFEDEDEEPASH